MTCQSKSDCSSVISVYELLQYKERIFNPVAEKKKLLRRVISRDCNIFELLRDEDGEEKVPQ